MTCIATAVVFIILLKSIIPMTLSLSCNGLTEIAVMFAEIMSLSCLVARDLFDKMHERNSVNIFLMLGIN